MWLAILGSQAAASPKDSKSGPKEWLLLQRHKEYGTHKVYLSADAVKLENASAGFAIISRAPDWRIVSFRPDDKVEYICPRSTYYEQNNFHPITAESEKHYIIRNSEPLDKIPVRAYCTRHDEYSFAQGLPLAPEVGAFLCAYYMMRPHPGIPTSANINIGPQKKEKNFWLGSNDPWGVTNFLRSESIKEIPYNAKDFAEPNGYRLAKSIKEIDSSAAARSGSKELLEDLGIGEKLGR